MVQVIHGRRAQRHGMHGRAEIRQLLGVTSQRQAGGPCSFSD
jgi:hypothetical protein